MATKVIMPQLGESVVEGTVTKWLHKEGETVRELESLLEVNTDKVDTEIPSPASGTLLKVLVPEGTTVRAGTTLAWIGQPDEAIPGEGDGGSGNHGAATAARQSDAQPSAAPLPSARSRDLGFISPVVARLARENNLDLSLVKGSGEGGRITKKDVLAYLAQRETSAAPAPVGQPAPWETPGEGDLFRPPEIQFAAGAPEATPSAPTAPPAAPIPPAPGLLPGRVIPLSPARRIIAERMVASKHTSPHVTTVMEADMSRVVAHREANKEAFARDGARLTFTAYFVAAAVAALRANPIANSSWSDEGILIHDSIHIGVATSLGEEGLIVPVIKNADRLSLLGIARAVNDLAERARSHRLQPDDVHGATFTITNHGVTGSLFANPIINQPQCAILGVGMIQKRVVVINDAIAIRPMVYLSLTFDHRVLDGAIADQVLAKFVETLQNWV